MEQKNVKIFYMPVEGGKLKEVECVADSMVKPKKDFCHL